MIQLQQKYISIEFYCHIILIPMCISNMYSAITYGYGHRHKPLHAALNECLLRLKLERGSILAK